jgi:radical SAM superfamily enzyme YgiQ (UPF0313 family)
MGFPDRYGQHVKTVLVPWLIGTHVTGRRFEIDVPLGLLSLAAAVRSSGHEVELAEVNPILADRSFHVAMGAICERLYAMQAAVYGFSTVVGLYHLTLQVAERLKALSPSSLVVFGGPHASLVAQATLEHFRFVDVIVRGEGEATFVRLLDAIESGSDLRTIRGIAFRDGHVAVVTPEAELIADLDDLPVPAFDLISKTQYTAPVVPIEPGRGCPFSCTYCSTSAYWGHRCRYKSPARCKQEIVSALEHHKAALLCIRHDFFLCNPRFVDAFCKQLQHVSGLPPWMATARAESLDQGTLTTIHHAGCRWLEFGVESPSPRIQTAIGKRLDPAEVLSTLRKVRSAGITTTVFLMCGFPEESLDDILMLLDFVGQLLNESQGPLYLQLRRVIPLPGTELFERHVHTLVYSPDMLPPGVLDTYPDAYTQLAQCQPALFPELYRLPTSNVFGTHDYIELLGFSSTVLEPGARYCPDSLRAVLAVTSGGVIQLWKLWRTYLQQSHARVRGDGGVFPFLKWITNSLDRNLALGLQALLRYEKCYYDIRVSYYHESRPRRKQGKWHTGRHVRIAAFACDIPSLVERFRSGKQNTLVEAHSTHVAFRADSPFDITCLKLTALAYNVAQACVACPTAILAFNRVRSVRRFCSLTRMAFRAVLENLEARGVVVRCADK